MNASRICSYRCLKNHITDLQARNSMRCQGSLNFGVTGHASWGGRTDPLWPLSQVELRDAISTNPVLQQELPLCSGAILQSFQTTRTYSCKLQHIALQAVCKQQASLWPLVTWHNGCLAKDC